MKLTSGSKMVSVCNRVRTPHHCRELRHHKFEFFCTHFPPISIPEAHGSPYKEKYEMKHQSFVEEISFEVNSLLACN